MPDILDAREPASQVENRFPIVDRSQVQPGTSKRHHQFPRRSSSTGKDYAFQLVQVASPLMLSDAVAVVTSYLVGFGATQLLRYEVNHFFSFAMCAAGAHLLCFWLSGSYPGIGCHPARELKQSFRGTLTASLCLLIGVLLLSTDRMSPYALIVVAAFLAQGIFHPVFRSLTKSMMRRINVGVPFYFVGNRENVMRVYRDMSRFGWTMMIPSGRFEEPRPHLAEEPHPPFHDEFQLKFERQVAYLGTPDRILPEADRNKVFSLIVVEDPVDSSIDSHVFSTFPEVIWIRPSATHACSGASIVNCGLASGVRVEEALLMPWPMFQKRMLDVCLSGAALLVFAPLVLVLALLVKLTSKGPVFYFHSRIGRGGMEFKAWKFRSMVSDAASKLEAYLHEHPEYRAEWERDHKLKNDPRVTWVGKLLRKTSLDELPQLWNVFVGEMSLVGPRPIVDAEIEKYGPTFREYLRVTPGITGLWQISGRNNTTYQERLNYDAFYVSHWSPWLDAYILMRTVKTVLLCEGAY